MKKHKKLKIWLLVILLLLVLGFSLYKVLYNMLAPVLFDMVVGRNPEAILQLGEFDENEDTTLVSKEETKEDDEKKETKPEKKETKSEGEKTKPDGKKPKPEEKETKSKGKETKSKGKDTKSEEKEETKKEVKKPGSYTTETYIGVLTPHDLAKVIKSISPADKTRIITICKSVVSASDMPRFASMATKGMKGDDYSFAESYLRSRLSPNQKKEIMEIVRKYLGR